MKSLIVSLLKLLWDHGNLSLEELSTMLAEGRITRDEYIYITTGRE